MPTKNDRRSIGVITPVKKRLGTYGKYGDSYESIIVKLMDKADELALLKKKR